MAKNLVYMTPDQIREVKTDIASLERMLASDEASRNPKIQDKAEFKAGIRKKKELLLNHEPKKLTGAQANKALKRAREIESRLKESLLNCKDYYQPQPKGSSTDFERAVKEEMRRLTDKKLKQEIFEYKNLMRTIDPSDPTLSNIERLRQ